MDVDCPTLPLQGGDHGNNVDMLPLSNIVVSASPLSRILECARDPGPGFCFVALWFSGVRSVLFLGFGGFGVPGWFLADSSLIMPDNVDL